MLPVMLQFQYNFSSCTMGKVSYIVARRVIGWFVSIRSLFAYRTNLWGLALCSCVLDRAFVQFRCNNTAHYRYIQSWKLGYVQVTTATYWYNVRAKNMEPKKMPLFAFLGSSRWLSTGPLPLKNMNSIIIKISSCTLLSSREAADNGGAMGFGGGARDSWASTSQSEGPGLEDIEAKEMGKDQYVNRHQRKTAENSYLSCPKLKFSGCLNVPT